MVKLMKASSTQTKEVAPKNTKASDPKNAESKANLSKVFGVPKK